MAPGAGSAEVRAFRPYRRLLGARGRWPRGRRGAPGAKLCATGGGGGRVQPTSPATSEHQENTKSLLQEFLRNSPTRKPTRRKKRKPKTLIKQHTDVGLELPRGAQGASAERGQAHSPGALRSPSGSDPAGARATGPGGPRLAGGGWAPAPPNVVTCSRGGAPAPPAPRDAEAKRCDCGSPPPAVLSARPALTISGVT